ncbi:MAG: hypothetical protein Q8S43_00010 [Actinomycetota bacterium]|nr:hypothetical protein [Actinomycetota bacterium]
MSELDPTLQTPETAAPSRGRRILGRVLLGIWWALIGLVTLGIVLYLFGGMWLRTPEMKSAYDELVLTGQQPAIEAAVVVPIPGCVCHSDDPVAQAQHSVYRIRDCFTCH